MAQSSRTVTIQIGNTDNKLTQQKWAEFIEDVNTVLTGTEYMFQGTSAGDKPYQNACWVVVMRDYEYETTKNLVARVGEEYDQDSIAWTEGKTEFI
jgi:predicted NodU family carbamoyl transferase